MRRITRKTFERLVCAGALALPLMVLLAAGVSEDRAYLHARGGAVVETNVAHKLGALHAVRVARVARLAAAGNPAVEAQAGAKQASLSYRTSWIGNTWGYADQRWMQIDVQALAVTPQGDVFTNAPWDEGGGELGQYRNGELVRHGGQTHGWGMMGGDAIAVNDEYVYVAQTMVSLGNETAKSGPTPRQGEVWTGVSRRSRADIRDGVPFAGQVKLGAGSRLAFLLISAYSSKADYAIRGLAADHTRLFVSNAFDNRVQIFDAQTMQALGAFPVREPGRIALASDGSLWIIEHSRTDRAQRVVHHARNGARLGELTLPEGVVPVDLSVDTRGRLLVADNGVRQQVLIFSADSGTAAGVAAGVTAGMTAGMTASREANAAGSTQQAATMKLTSSFGQEGGIYAGRAGAPGPRRFNGLTGVGVDRAGNIYVAMNGAGPRPFGNGPGTYDGALLESYTPDGRQRFSLQGLLFVDGAQFVDGDPPSVYSGSKRFTLDLTRAPGEEWSYAGYTADRFRYPYDPYFHLYLGAQRGMPMVRDIDGHRLLYTTDMYSSYLRIYRFAGDRETAIPSGLFAQSHIDGAWPRNQPVRGEWIWRDATGAGDFSAAAFDVNSSGANAPALKGWWVDSRGDIWQGTEAQGIRCFPLLGFDRVGNPVYRYSAMRHYAAPAPFYRVARLNYFPDGDTLFISGSTPARPFVQANWNGAGSQLARYDHWKSGKPVLRYLIDLPDRGAPEWLSINGFAVAGDYIFAVETRSATVRVYDRASGGEVGRLTPGKEVGSTSGWVDVPMPVTAHRLASGEYLVFVEEDAHGKALMYRFTPPATRPAAAPGGSPSHSSDVATNP